MRDSSQESSQCPLIVITEEYVFTRVGGSPEGHLAHSLLGARGLSPVQGQEWSMLDPSQKTPSTDLFKLDFFVVVTPEALTVGQVIPHPLLGYADQQVSSSNIN